MLSIVKDDPQTPQLELRFDLRPALTRPMPQVGAMNTATAVATLYARRRRRPR